MTGATSPTRKGSTKIGRAAVAAALAERLAFERLLADLSARFAHIASDGVVAEIERALAQLRDFFGYDRCTYAEFTADGTLNVLCSVASGGMEPLPCGAFGAGFTWFLGELRAGRIVALAALPDGLPPEALAEAEHWERLGLHSNLSIPLHVRGRVIGVLSFAGFRNARAWPPDVITRLSIIGEVFASTMARARYEEETQRLLSKLWHADRVARVSALTAAIAHELNQPLTAILSNAQAGLAYLRRGAATPEEVRSILEAVVRDDKRAAETIRTMRALLRRDETGHGRIDLAAALREVLQLLAAEFTRQGIRVETRFETGCWVRADKAQIEQVALNLMLNAAAAMEACPRAERWLRLSVSRTGDGRVVAALCDSGIGVAAKDIDAIFESFWTTSKQGLGLGLSICRSIVEAHGGAIALAPNPDRGVTVRFELTAASEDDLRDAGEPVAGAAAEASLRAAAAEPAVCIIDDDAAVRESVQRLLWAAGWTAASYASADDFLAHRPRADVACILLDIRMPGLSGLELQARLSRMGTAPSIVFLTGHGDVAVSVDAMKLGAVDFLTKPVEARALIGAVRKALARHDRERRWAIEREACMAKIRRLSAREHEVTAQVIRGRLNKQIAADLKIAEQTVKQHRARVMEKMEVGSVAELVRVWEAAGVSAGRGLQPADRERP